MPRRQRLSLRGAHALIALHGPDVPEHLNQVVALFRLAGAAVDAKEALGYFVKAGQAAERVFAWEDAANHYRAALELLDASGEPDTALEVELLQALISALLPAGVLKPVLDEVAPRAYALAELRGDRERMGALARAYLEAMYREWGPLGIGAPEAQLWLARADTNTEHEGRARLLLDSRSAMLRRITSSPEYWPVTMKAYAAARASGETDIILDAAAYGPLVLGAPTIEGVGDMKLAFAEVSRLPRVDVPMRTRGTFLRNWVDASVVCGDRRAFDAGVDELSGVVAQLGDAFLGEELWNGRINQRLLDGDLPGALTLFRERIDAEPRPGEYSRLFAIGTIVRVLLLRGQRDEARSLLDEVPVYYETIVPPAWRTIAAFFFASVGEVQRARQRVDEWLRHDRINETCLINEIAGAMQAALALGDHELVSQIAPQMESLVDLPVCGWQAYVAPGRLLAEAAGLEGNHAAARRYLEVALTSLEQIRYRPELALTRLDLTELLLSHYPDERAEAGRLLDLAVDELEAMGMQPALQRAQALAARASVRARRPDDLSPRQLEVLRLIAEGRTTREIAEILVLSERTVERHIGDIYTKIGARNRAEATAYELSYPDG